MRYWEHEVSAEWLEARRQCLTATDIVKLLPELKRCKKLKPGEISPGFAAMWAEKHSTMELSTKSIKAAARGHIMEPWVVEEWSREHPLDPYWHWDNCVIRNGPIGFSPDALPRSQATEDYELVVSHDKKALCGSNGYAMGAPQKIMEIKCYEAGNHMKACVANKMDHKEIWQIATAFYVLPYLKSAKLVFCCPGAPIEMHVEDYTRDDLKEYLDTIGEVVTMYVKTSLQCDKLERHNVNFTEAEVYEEYIESLNEKANNTFAF